MFKEVRSLSIWSRKRGKRYTKKQAMQIEELPKRYLTKHQNIRRLLKIPSSLFKLLKSEANREHNAQLVPKWRQDQTPKLHDSEKKFIENMIRPPNFPKPFMKFKEKLKETFQEESSPSDIKKFIKENLNYSYKKESSRVLACKTPSLRELQAIFSCRMLRALRENEILINID